jgi:hypothetical protein
MAYLPQDLVEERYMNTGRNAKYEVLTAVKMFMAFWIQLQRKMGFASPKCWQPPKRLQIVTTQTTIDREQ